jgi:hypothetical protein
MGRDAITDMEGFELGEPALVCRWRLANRRLPLENRHMRALLARTVNGAPVSTELVAWAKQHIEWTLEQGSAEHPNGVLMLIVDKQGRAAMTVGPFAPLEDVSLMSLVHRAERSATEAEQTGVAPETLWLVQGGSIVHSGAVGRQASAACSLIEDLAHTLGIPTVRREMLPEEARLGLVAYDEAFLVSDEHGVVGVAGHEGAKVARFAGAYERLLATERTRHPRQD